MMIAINDANILIDLYKLDLLNEFFELDFEFITSDFVYNELRKKQEQIDGLKLIIEKKLLKIQTFSYDEIMAIESLRARNSAKLSFEDCSVWYLAQVHKAILITGDKLLRKNATKEKIEVRGILFVFNELVNMQIITPKTATRKLNKLMEINNRLPLEECNKLLAKWNNL